MSYYDAIIIDSGYSGNRKGIDGRNLTSSCRDDLRDPIDHGTAVVDLILHQNPEAKVYVIKLCNTYDDFTEEDLCSALEHILRENLFCGVINISLGIQKLRDYARLKGLLHALKERNAVTVSAFHPFSISFPAAFEEVIGVDVSEKIKHADEYLFNENSGIDLVGTNSYIRMVDGEGHGVLKKGSSFVAAKISGLLVSFFRENPAAEDRLSMARAYLKANARYTYTFPVIPHNQGKRFVQETGHAILLPFNKEIYPIAANEDLLSFSVDAYYDFGISLNKNKRIRELLPYSDNSKVVTAFSEIRWDEGFDTVICGHCREYEEITGKPFHQELIRLCKKNGKRLYSFDDFSSAAEKEHLDDYFCPDLSADMVRREHFNKLYEFGKPVVAVMGTSSVQGKFSVQLYLRRQLTAAGYKVSNIGTEPTGYLFGFDSVLPTGYGSGLRLTSYEFVNLLNSAVHEAEEEMPDLLIVGSQSGTVPAYRNNLQFLLFRQYELLQACDPDAVILTVNSFDEIGYIRKTIQFIESGTHAKVIALVVSPLKISSEGILRARREPLAASECPELLARFRTAFKIPVYLFQYNIEELPQTVIDFFS